MGQRKPILMVPRPGEIFWEYLRDDGPHPVVVVSREELNRGDYVVCVMFTSGKLETRRHLANCLPFRAGQYGLPKNCVAQSESITYIDKSYLDLETGPIGALDPEAMRDLTRAIGYVISADCEPV